MCHSHPRNSVLACSVCLAAAAIVLAAGCQQQEMANQARVETYEVAPFFADGSGARVQVKGTVARGQDWRVTTETTGKKDGEFVTNPFSISAEHLQRGRKLFAINCQHCHGLAGYGDGMVVKRGFPQPPSFHTDSLRDAADGRLFEVITKGQRSMPALGNLIAPEDRWSIVAYVRALQLSQHVEESDLTDADRDSLSEVSDKRRLR